MKKLTLLIASTILLSTAATASTFSTHSERTFDTDKYASQSQAMDAAKNLMTELSQMNNAQLKHRLSISDNIDYPSLKIDNMDVELHKFTNFEGKTSYSATVGVAYQYTHHESNS